MSDQPVLTNLDDDGVLLVTWNRPKKKNAFNDPQWDAFTDVLNEARENDAVAVMVVTGAGDDFSAGVDLASFGSAGEREDGKPSGYFSCMDALFAYDKPILAAARGVGVGIGATFLFAADIVYVGESVRLRLPFVNLGLVPEAASSYLLAQRVGTQRAAELLFTAEWIDAARAVEVGIAAGCFPDDALLEATMDKAREIAQWPISALRGTKQTLMAAHKAGIEAALEVENEGMMKLGGSPANIEAIKAFIEKRKPDFKKLR